jgi:SAM-dependent methyltransferase
MVVRVPLAGRAFEHQESGTGRALDVGCGEGADAVWLAERGWQVTAVDISTTALERAAAHAAAAGPQVAGRIQWIHADLRDQPPAEDAYDLVSSQFMHLPSEARQELFARLAAATAPGGTLLIVGHHPSDLRTTAHRMHFPDMMFTAEEVAASLDPTVWEVLAAETRPRAAVDPRGTRHHHPRRRPTCPPPRVTGARPNRAGFRISLTRGFDRDGHAWSGRS